MISEPINPLACHLGGGVVQIQVEPPLSGEVKKYEIHTATSLDGPYKGVSKYYFTTSTSFLYDFTVGLTAYMKVRAIGTDGSVSDWVQVKRGIAVQQEVEMLCRSHENSVIPAGALFTCKSGVDRIIGFIASEDIVFSE